jgi:rifampicin phosphotransferase
VRIAPICWATTQTSPGLGPKGRKTVPSREALTLRLDGSAADVSLLGGKGSSLDRLIAWGFPVPPTGVVTTETYRRFVSDPLIALLLARIRSGEQVSESEIDELFAHHPFDPDVAREVVELARVVGGDNCLAIRSSATVEDLNASSFAGQYVSLLNVDPDDEAAVLGGVAKVFASLWHPVPCAYRRAFGIADDNVAMAAVLMRMVSSQRSGVVFTTDPGGQPGSARIEVVSGLGESLVSGQTTPDAYVVSRETPPLDLPQEVRQALDLALEVERRSGVPQDVEWAWDGTTTTVVQARPITVEADDDGFDSAVTDDELTTAAIGETLPGVLPPLIWQLDSHIVNEAFNRVLDDLGVLSSAAFDAPLVRRVRGRAALDFTQFQAMAKSLPGRVDSQLEKEYFGTGASSVRSRTDDDVTSPKRGSNLVHDARVLLTRRRTIEDADTIGHVCDAVLDAHVVLQDATDRELLAYRGRLLDQGVRAMADELAVAAIAVSAFAQLQSMLAAHLGSASGVAAQKLTTTAGVSVGADRRSSVSVFAGPTWEELGRDPGAADYRTRPAGALESAFDELVAELATKPTWSIGDLRSYVRVTALRRIAVDAVTQLRRRERTKAAVMGFGGEIRRIHLEFGRRLSAAGILRSPEQIDLLRDAELREALVSSVAPPSAVLARRRRWIDRYEGEAALPLRFRGRPTGQPVALPPGQRFAGWPASSGRVSGVAQVVRSPTGRFEPGCVLVAEATDASWSPLFGLAAGIVLERGGPLSHAAIVARELGVPAVMNVPGATQGLDGRRVVVDGDVGAVVIIDEKACR